MKYWLLKTEPGVFSIHDLAAARNQTTCWEGVRNYQARNLLRDEFQVGDRALIYHSGGKAPAVVGVAQVSRAAYPDHHSWDPKSSYYDPGSTAESPRWYMVDIQLEAIFDSPVTLAEIRGMPELAEMQLLRKGNRLSVQPVTRSEFNRLVKAGRSTRRAKGTADA